eukprot:TRINITY_DN2265_c0_g1_i1.p1 TRINITY_DN2265_c0_g1~~TRINITY_DN2265_c0_g1_i1.p1  ORF type:complete len:1022 (+),score=235.39 TRINITY_DN2265_c0_g1_i1:213-3278(+)
MANLFNKVLVSMLSKYLQYYMNDFARDTFKLQVLKGTFELENMEINCQFLKDTVVLPNLEITECRCDKMHLHIPWHNITAEPIQFDLDTIYMTMVEIPPGQQPQFEVKNKRVKPASYSFVQKCIDGIKMSVKEVNITIQLNGYRNNPSIARIKTSNIKIYSCGPDWRPVDLKESFVTDKKTSEVLFYKILECGSLEVAFADLSPDRKNADEPPQYAVIMKDIPVNIRCKVLKDKTDSHVICGAFDMVMDHMAMSFTDGQWKGFLELIKSMVSCFTRTDQEYSFYREVGQEFLEGGDEEVELDEDGNPIKKDEKKASTWNPFSWGGKPSAASAAASKEKKEQREKERFDKEKQKRIVKWEQREKEREALASKGEDTTHLDMNETTFNILITKGCLNMIDDEHAMTEDPAYDAFARLHFEEMKVIMTLPPASDVPDTNKWTDVDPHKRLLSEALLEMKHMALVLQEKPTKKRKGEKRKQVVLVTDGRSESLQVKATKQTRKLKNKKKEKAKGEDDGEKKGKKDSGKMLPFSAVKWSVVSHAPNERDMAKWLKSLDCQMQISVFESHLLVLHQWWARVVSYLETASTGSTDIQALALMKLTVALDVTGNYMTIPLTASDELVVTTMEEILQDPHLELYSTKIIAGKKALDKATKKIFAGVRLKEAYQGPAKDKEIMTAEDRAASKAKLRDVSIKGYGTGKKKGWLAQELLRKPQRYEFLFENMSLSINKRKILAPINFEFELALHRYETVEQLLLEIFVRAPVMQLNMSRADYVMFTHFMDHVMQQMWIEITMVLMRKYGPDRLQKQLNDKSYHQLSVDQQKMPIIVYTYAFLDFLIITLNKEKSKHDSLFLDETESSAAPAKGDGSDGDSEGVMLELHLNDVKSRSHNDKVYKTGAYSKTVECNKISVYAPPEGGKAVDASEAGGEGEGAPEGEDAALLVRAVDGSVYSSEIPAIRNTLKHNNEKALAKLLASNRDEVATLRREVGNKPGVIKVEKSTLKFDDKPVATLPPVIAGLLRDFMGI